MSIRQDITTQIEQAEAALYAKTAATRAKAALDLAKRTVADTTIMVLIVVESIC